MMAAKSDKENERRLDILAELMKEAGNKECADCSAKGPRWASWSIGIFLCINCAGIHRSLGTHISKVKSATLDKWTEEQVERMQNMGNARAKEIYEASVPSHYSIPTSGSSAHALENWIKAKYERREFVQRGMKFSSPEPSPSRERRDRDKDREKRRAEREKRRAERERRRELEERGIQRSQSPSPQVAPPPQSTTTATTNTATAMHHHRSSSAPAKQSTDLHELLGFADGTPNPEATSSPKVDKASIMSLYATPMQPSMGLHTTNHVRMQPNYNISFGGNTSYMAPTSYMMSPQGYGGYPMGYQAGGYAPTSLYNTPLSTGITVPMGYGGQVRLN